LEVSKHNYLSDPFCRQIPIEDTILFLDKLSKSHPFLVDEEPESWKVLNIIECIMEKKSEELKEKIKTILLKLVKSGTPNAEKILTKI
jgi:hypothetical protein